MTTQNPKGKKKQQNGYLDLPQYRHLANKEAAKLRREQEEAAAEKQYNQDKLSEVLVK